MQYVFDTHAHGDHSYGNSMWTGAGARVDLYAAVDAQIKAGEALVQVAIDVPDADHNRISQDLSLDVDATFNEITQHAPAGSLAHVWK